MLVNYLQTDSDLRDFTNMVVKAALMEAKILPAEISQREAWRRFGAVNVKRWLAKGILDPIKGEGKNCKMFYSVAELERAEWLEKQSKKRR